MRAALRDAMLWLAVCGALVVGYSYPSELTVVGDRVLGELTPRRGVETAGGTMTFRAASDGHFHVDAAVDGTTLRPTPAEALAAYSCREPRLRPV
jgi:predicted aspartyl protease